MFYSPTKNHVSGDSLNHLKATKHDVKTAFDFLRKNGDTRCAKNKQKPAHLYLRQSSAHTLGEKLSFCSFCCVQKCSLIGRLANFGGIRESQKRIESLHNLPSGNRRPSAPLRSPSVPKSEGARASDCLREIVIVCN